MGSPDSRAASPDRGRRQRIGARSGDYPDSAREVEGMKLIKRLAIAIGSLAALALAGGAHMRL